MCVPDRGPPPAPPPGPFFVTGLKMPVGAVVLGRRRGLLLVVLLLGSVTALSSAKHVPRLVSVRW